MINKISFSSVLIAFGVPLLLISTLFFLTKSSWFVEYPKELSIGITLDLLFIIPFVYFLIIKKRAIPKITIVSFFIIGLITASYILPENQQTFLLQVKTYIFPIIELGVLSFLIFKIRKTTIEFRRQKTSHLDFFDAVEIACKSSFSNKIATLLATELAVVYYGFFLWKKRRLKENEFTNYKDSGLLSLLFVLMLVVFVETFTLHKLLEDWSFIAAWVLTGISIYTVLQIFALIKSLARRPLVVDLENEQVLLRFGFFGKAIIPFQSISKVDLSSKDLPEDKSISYFSPLGSLGGHNVILYLNNEIEFEGFYGLKKNASSLAISVDDKIIFTQLVKSKITNDK